MPHPVPSTPAPAPGPVDPSVNSEVAEHQSQPPQTTDKGMPLPWLARAQTGDMVEAWMGGMLRHRGAVDECAPPPGVVWIQELGTGMRIMLDLAETDLR